MVNRVTASRNLEKMLVTSVYPADVKALMCFLAGVPLNKGNSSNKQPVQSPEEKTAEQEQLVKEHASALLSAVQPLLTGAMAPALPADERWVGPSSPQTQQTWARLKQAACTLFGAILPPDEIQTNLLGMVKGRYDGPDFECEPALLAYFDQLASTLMRNQVATP
jgi:hypothetical protein